MVGHRSDSRKGKKDAGQVDEKKQFAAQVNDDFKKLGSFGVKYLLAQLIQPNKRGDSADARAYDAGRASLAADLLRRGGYDNGGLLLQTITDGDDNER